MPLRRRVHASGERGFTLVEMLVAMSIGVVILLAAFTLLDRSFTTSAQIADRQEGLQRGRQAMELITRQLRSQVCGGAAGHHLLRARHLRSPARRQLLRQPQREQHERGEADAHV
jgi:prepilin-type N-terminal cleavage/methylation domain-containing protein